MSNVNKKPIPHRVYNPSKEHPYVAGAIDIIDDSKGRSQEDVNKITDNTFAFQQGEINALDSQNYKSYTASDGDTLSDILPEEGSVDTVYRVGSWDGNSNSGSGAYAVNVYSEYAWDAIEEVYKLMDVKQYGIDNEVPSVVENPGNLVTAEAIHSELLDIKRLWRGADTIGSIGDGVINTDNNGICTVIPLKGNETIAIRARVTMYYTFAKSFNYPNFEKTSWLDVYRNTIDSSATLYIDLNDGNHSEAKYLIIEKVTVGENRWPSMIKINGDDIDDYFAKSYVIDKIYDAVKNVNPYWEGFFVEGRLGGESYLSGAGSKSIVFPLKGTETIVMQGCAAQSSYTLADSYLYPGFTPHDGYSPREMLPSEGYYVTIQADGAKYLIVELYRSGVEEPDRTPLSVKVDGREVIKYDIRKDIDNRIDKQTFEHIVGEGINRRIEITKSNVLTTVGYIGTSVGYRLLKGETVTYHLTYKSSQPDILIQVTRDFVSGFYPEGDPHYPYSTVILRANNDNFKHEYEGTYTATSDCYIKFRSIVPTEDYPNNIASAEIEKTITDALTPDVPSRGLLKYFNIGTPRTIITAKMGNHPECVYGIILWTSVVTVHSGLYYMYLQAAPKGIKNDIYGLCFAWSTDGEHWHTPYFDNGVMKMDYPDGITPVDEDYSNTGVLFKVGRSYRTEIYQTSSASNKTRYCIGILEQREQQRGFEEACVTMVQDDEYPFRLIGNKTVDYIIVEYDAAEHVTLEDIQAQVDEIISHIPTDDNVSGERRLLVLLKAHFGAYLVSTADHYKKMYMFKSVDGVHWGDYDNDGIEISELAYDTQYSLIPHGDTIKVYGRGWDRTMTEEKKQRNIAVMTIDLGGNILSPFTTLFGDGMYNPAAFKIDDKRELLLPTFFDIEREGSTVVKDENTVYSYIVNGSEIIHSSDIDDKLRGITHVYDDYTGDDPDIIALKEEEEAANTLKRQQWLCVNPGFILKDGDIYLTFYHNNASHEGGVPSESEVKIIQLSWSRNGTDNEYLRKPSQI